MKSYHKWIILFIIHVNFTLVKLLLSIFLFDFSDFKLKVCVASVASGKYGLPHLPHSKAKAKGIYFLWSSTLEYTFQNKIIISELYATPWKNKDNVKSHKQ